MSEGDDMLVHLFYGAGRPAELVLWDELERAIGRLGADHLHGALLDPPDFYVAGPSPMTDATVELLRGNGIQLDRVHYDSFG